MAVQAHESHGAGEDTPKSYLFLRVQNSQGGNRLDLDGLVNGTCQRRSFLVGGHWSFVRSGKGSS